MNWEVIASKILTEGENFVTRHPAVTTGVVVVVVMVAFAYFS